ncbi:MAG: hydroxymethylbilane synthase, partial [Reinekea forsetii]|nr:hydroxymethylbilane synthase [Reinekea forsetii]
TALRVRAERAMNRKLNGGCEVPIAGYATLGKHSMHLEGRVGSVDGVTLLKASAEIPLVGSDEEQMLAGEQLGVDIADQLLAQGAATILAAL